MHNHKGQNNFDNDIYIATEYEFGIIIHVFSHVAEINIINRGLLQI